MAEELLDLGPAEGKPGVQVRYARIGGEKPVCVPVLHMMADAPEMLGEFSEDICDHSSPRQKEGASNY